MKTKGEHGSGLDDIKRQVNWGVFGTAAVIVVTFTLVTLVAPDTIGQAIGVVVERVGNGFGWLYVGLTTACVVFVAVLAMSKFGKIRLGPKHSKPEYSLFSWIAMLFAAGIATDLMFYSVSEAVTQYSAPPVGEGGTVEAARAAPVWTLFHYGLNGWGPYTLMGLALAYFAFRRNKPLSIRSTLEPIFGRHVNGPLGFCVDIAAILATVFGIAATLGLGLGFLNYGAAVLFGVPEGLPAQAVLLLVAVLASAVSAVSGVDRGIRILSQAAVVLSVLLLAFVVIAGDTVFLLQGFIRNVGDYATNFIGLSTETFAFQDNSEWMNAWTNFFWAWWIAWTAFIGLFLARISRGRTIREFVIGTLTLPLIYVLLWTSFLGNSAVARVRGGDTELEDSAINMPAHSLHDLLSNYPGYTFIAAVTTMIGLLLYVTSNDSGAVVLARISTKTTVTRGDGHPALRIFWTTAIGVLTLAILAAGGVGALQSSTIIFGLPFAVVLILVMYALLRALRDDSIPAKADPRSLNGAGLGGQANSREKDSSAEPRPISRWYRRRRLDSSHPRDFISEVALPAMSAMSEELARIGVESTVISLAEEDDPGAVLDANVDGDCLFRYELRPGHTVASQRPESPDQRLFSVVVHTPEGSKHHDIAECSFGHVMDDIADQYELALMNGRTREYQVHSIPDLATSDHDDADKVGRS